MPSKFNENYSVFVEKKYLSEGDNIFRYFDFPGFMDLFLNNRLLLTRVDKFEDKFEGNFTKSIYKKLRFLSVEKEGNRQDFANIFEKESKRIKERAYVSSWSLAIHENMALWKLFGNGKNALAIQTSVGNLKNSLQDGIRESSTNGFIFSLLKKKIVKIQYIDYDNHEECIGLLSTKDKTCILGIKHLGFRFEEEVRVIFEGEEAGREAAVSKIGEKCFVNVAPLGLIDKLIVSPLADEWFYELVCKVSNKIKIEWSAMRSTPYETLNLIKK